MFMCMHESFNSFELFFSFSLSLFSLLFSFTIRIGNARAGYTSISKQYQILYHHSEYDNGDDENKENDEKNAEIDNNVINSGASTSSTSSTSSSPSSSLSSLPAFTHGASSTEYIPNAPNSVTYTIYGYRHSQIRTILYHVISILFLGIPYLIAHTSISFYVWLKFKKSELNVCDIVLGLFTKNLFTESTASGDFNLKKKTK